MDRLDERDFSGTFVNKKSSTLISQNIFTARIRRMGKVIFSVCPHLRGGGGVAHPRSVGWRGGSPSQVWVEGTLSQVWGGSPSQVWMVGGTPWPGLDGGGSPWPVQDLGGYPIPGLWVGGGLAHPRSGWGVPYPRSGGYPIPGLDGGGVPPDQVWMVGVPPDQFWMLGGTPWPGLDGGGYPLTRSEWVWMVGGTPWPGLDGGWGVPPLPPIQLDRAA